MAVVVLLVYSWVIVNFGECSFTSAQKRAGNAFFAKFSIVSRLQIHA